MEKLINEQTETSAQPATAEQNLGASEGEVSLGKFKDVNALLSAYNSLESEFTKRCQKIKELEGALSSIDKVEAPKEELSEVADVKTDITDKEKEDILKEYLQDVMLKKQKAVLLDGTGVGVKTPITRPKTITQAGELARQILTKQN